MNKAKFKVIKIDPEGSGLDFSGHLNFTVENAKRCCKNCTIIWGTIGNTEVGPFVRGELEPLNEEAKQILEQINEFVDSRPPRQPAIVIISKQFKRQLAILSGDTNIDLQVSGLNFETKIGKS